MDLGRGSLLRLEDSRALCLDCADLDELDFLPRGDTALTRRARKHSTLQAVVVEWSRTRNRYERQGILVEPQALLKAEEACLADAEVRARQRARAALERDEEDAAYITSFAAAIHSAYPGCPADEAQRIAAHACRRHSGRIGRAAAAKAFDPQAIRLAVAAHIRHVHTDYDRLLAQMWDRHDARSEVADRVEAVLQRWSEPASI